MTRVGKANRRLLALATFFLPACYLSTGSPEDRPGMPPVVWMSGRPGPAPSPRPVCVEVDPSSLLWARAVCPPGYREVCEAGTPTCFGLGERSPACRLAGASITFAGQGPTCAPAR